MSILHICRARIHASAGVLLLAVLAAPGVVPDAVSQTLTVTDIGGPATPGMASFGSAVTVSSRGWDVNGTSDQFTFVYRSLTGDTSVVARVDSLQNVDPWAQAGLMIRESLAANANHASVLASAGSGVVFRSRKSAKAGTNQAKTLSGGAPAWLKLERRGSTFTASYLRGRRDLVARGLGEAAVRSVRAGRVGRGQPQPVRQHDGRPVERVDRRPRLADDVERCANRDADLAPVLHGAGASLA